MWKLNIKIMSQLINWILILSGQLIFISWPIIYDSDYTLNWAIYSQFLQKNVYQLIDYKNKNKLLKFLDIYRLSVGTLHPLLQAQLICY